MLGAARTRQLRDARYLRRAGDDPGPAGRLLQAWRRLAERNPLDKAVRLELRSKEWMIDLTNALDVPVDDALEDLGDAAKTLAVGSGFSGEKSAPSSKPCRLVTETS